MKTPTMDDYVELLCTLFERFAQEYPEHESALFTDSNQMLIVLSTFFQFRRICKFKAQRRWLEEHPEMLKRLGWTSMPHLVTLSRRYKALCPVLQAFVQFVGQYTREVDARLRQRHLVSDKVPFKALGPVWHETDRAAHALRDAAVRRLHHRQAQRIPAKLRHLDTDATWSKSDYHGWVYGYGLHLTCNEVAFPALVQVETATVAEAPVIEQQEPILLLTLKPGTLVTDNNYAKASRIRRWAKLGVVLPHRPVSGTRVPLPKPISAFSSKPSMLVAYVSAAPPLSHFLISLLKCWVRRPNKSNYPFNSCPASALVSRWRRSRFNLPCWSTESEGCRYAIFRHDYRLFVAYAHPSVIYQHAFLVA